MTKEYQNIKVFDKLLDHHILKDINDYLNSATFKYGWGSSEKVDFRHWHHHISGSGISSSVDARDGLPQQFKRLWAQLNITAFGDTAKLLIAYSNRHTYGVDGYAHTDSEDDKSVTIIVYLNEKWDIDWGGETVFFTFERDDIVRSVLPIFGRYAIFPGNIPHAARTPSRACPDVRTTLVFKALLQEPEQKPFDQREYISDFLTAVGAHQRPHMNGTLKDHLLKTHDIILECFPFFMDVNMIAMIGALHSIYGTNFYRDGCLEVTDTFLPKKFGFEVDRLVRLFGTIDKPRVLENPDGSLEKEDLRILRAVEIANLMEQGGINEYPNLMQFLMTKGEA